RGYRHRMNGAGKAAECMARLRTGVVWLRRQIRVGGNRIELEGRVERARTGAEQRIIRGHGTGRVIHLLASLEVFAELRQPRLKSLPTQGVTQRERRKQAHSQQRKGRTADL